MEQRNPYAVYAVVVTGKQPFMGQDIPVVLGGFYLNARCACDKTIAAIHGMETKNVRARITENLSRFRENIDYIDLKTGICQTDDDSGKELLTAMGYSAKEISKSAHIYILSERGYAKLVKIMNSDHAWDIYENFLDEYFFLRETIRQDISIQNVPQELQLQTIFDNLCKTEAQQKEQAEALETVNQKIDNIRDVMSLNINAWRSECRYLLMQIAKVQGRGATLEAVNEEVFRLLDERAGVLLDRRLTSKRKRMMEQGACKTNCAKITKVDVIAEDKKLTEIYIAIVKEMAVANGVGLIPEKRRVPLLGEAG